MSECVFCEIAARRAPAQIVRSWPGVLAIVPLNPVTDGHVLVLPEQHVADFAEDAWVTALVMFAASKLAVPPANLITSAGPEATQTVFHLHIHVVPRTADDGLRLPWSPR